MSERTGNELRAEVPWASRGRWWGGGLVVVTLIAFGLFWLLRAPEPEYQGRRVKDLLRDLALPAHSGSYQYASNAVVALGEQALPVIVQGIEQQAPWHARQFLKFQSKLPANVRTLMFRWLDPHSHDNLRIGSVRALELVGTNAAPAATELVRAFGRLDYALASPLSQALVRVGPAVVPALAPQLTDSDLKKRGLAVSVMYQLGPASAGAARELIAGLTGADENHRRLVAQTLGRMGTAALPQTTSLLASTNAAIRLVAVRAMNQLLPRARELTPELMGLLEDFSPEVRFEAASMLVNWWKLPAEEWRRLFLKLPADHASRVRYGRSLDALEAGDARLVEVLREGLDMSDPRRRLEAATRLVQINRANADVVSALQVLHTNLNGAPWEMAGLTNLLQRARQQLTNAPVTAPRETLPRPGTARVVQSPP